MTARDLARLAQLAATLRWRLTDADDAGDLTPDLRAMVEVAEELSRLASAAAREATR